MIDEGKRERDRKREKERVCVTDILLMITKNRRMSEVW